MKSDSCGGKRPEGLCSGKSPAPKETLPSTGNIQLSCSAVGPADKAGQNLVIWSTPTSLFQLPGAKAASTNCACRRSASGDAREHVGLNTYVRLWTRCCEKTAEAVFRAQDRCKRQSGRRTKVKLLGRRVRRRNDEQSSKAESSYVRIESQLNERRKHAQSGMACLPQF